MNRTRRAATLGLACLLLAACSGGYGATPTPSTVPGWLGHPLTFGAGTWGYIGCSATQDAVAGYSQAPASRHLFWSADGYELTGKTLSYWSDQYSPAWQLFDAMKRKHNGGADPPVVWVQICIGIDRQTPDYSTMRFTNAVAMIDLVHNHAPTSRIYVSPLQAYSPAHLCPLLEPGRVETDDVSGWLSQTVVKGQTLAGPGVGYSAQLGPLTMATTTADRCHPNAAGSALLGRQMVGFFDSLS